MKAVGITTWFQFTQGQCLGAKKKWQNSFAVLAIILPLISLLFCLSLENRHYLTACECSCVLCTNIEIFCPNNGRFQRWGCDRIPCIPMPYVYVRRAWRNMPQLVSQLVFYTIHDACRIFDKVVAFLILYELAYLLFLSHSKTYRTRIVILHM